jgi:hypothetical protein
MMFETAPEAFDRLASSSTTDDIAEDGSMKRETLPPWTRSPMLAGFALLFSLLGAGQPAAAADFPYTAVTVAPRAARQGTVRAGSLTWKCSGNRCMINGPWPTPGVSACNALARQVGQLASYGHPKAHLTAAQLAECNAGAAASPGAVVLPRRIPGTLGVTDATAVTARTSRATKRFSAAPSREFSGGAGLGSFDFSFLNGDHKLREISIFRGSDSALFSFADGDSNDPFAADAVWWQSPAFIQSDVSGEGGGEFEIDITPPATGRYTPVLTGFSFRRTDTTDANVRVMGVRIEPRTNKIRVDLLDDQGPDFRGIFSSGNVLETIFVPNGALLMNIQSAAVLRGIFDNRSDVNHFRRYRVNVQYAWVPDSMITGHGALSGSSPSYDSGQLPSADGKAVIQGFLLAFTNSDHYLQQTKVMVEGRSANPPSGLGRQLGLGSARGRAAVEFKDSDGNDPIEWHVNWVTVR